MPATRIDLGPKPKPYGRALTKLRVHIHAFARAPKAYMLALWWRLCGKRVRARAQLAPLLAMSPLAYRLWLRTEKVVDLAPPGETKSPIIALIDVAREPNPVRLEKTLRSLGAQRIDAILVGSLRTPTLRDVIPNIDWRQNPWFLPIAVGDTLGEGAVAAYRGAAATTKAKLIYADDDLLDARGQRHTPHFKPRWNAELFRHFDYLSGACVVRASAPDFVALHGRDWAERLIQLAASVHEPENAPLHIPSILHHRLSRPTAVVPKALTVLRAELPTVSVIIPTRNRVDLLRTCLEGLMRTDYRDLEVLVVDNDSDDPAALAYLNGLEASRYTVLRHPGAFNFSAINNRAATTANGRLLCLLNNDIEVIEPDWLATMALQALRPEVGAVGARLLYPNGRIQHAGVVLGIGGGAAHAHRLLRPEDQGYFQRHSLPQFVSAVTAACLVVLRDRFVAVDGFDERAFPVAFNDVDLCMRLNAKGWRSFYEPRATLIHHESVSRGLDRDPVGAARFAQELAALTTRWKTQEQIDPYHHPELNRFSERFVVRL